MSVQTLSLVFSLLFAAIAALSAYFSYTHGARRTAIVLDEIDPIKKQILNYKSHINSDDYQGEVLLKTGERIIIYRVLSVDFGAVRIHGLMVNSAPIQYHDNGLFLKPLNREYTDMCLCYDAVAMVMVEPVKKEHSLPGNQ